MERFKQLVGALAATIQFRFLQVRLMIRIMTTSITPRRKPV
jgi:hypothetical protein